MWQLKRHAKKLHRPHSSPTRRRNVIAATVAAASLGIYSLSGCHHASPYAGSSAHPIQSDPSITGNPCTKPTVIPMDPGNAQRGITKGKYFITNDSWNAGHYHGLLQTLHVCNYNSWYAVATMNDDA